MNWDSSFELYPSPGDQGAVTNSALREIKELVKEYMSIQHTWDDSSSPECPHIPGKSTVVNVEASPSALNVVGALAYSTTNNILYRDRGGGLGFEAAGGTSHSSLLNLTDSSAHSQYVLTSGSALTNVSLSAGYKVKSLNTTEVGYTPSDVMPYSLHIGESISGGAKHSDDVITSFTGVSLSCVDKIKSSTVDSGAIVVAGHGNTQWLIGRMAFIPLAAPDMTSYFQIHPLFNATPPDDWVSGFTFYNPFSSSSVFHMTSEVVDA
jgi:hypothetical protein